MSENAPEDAPRVSEVLERLNMAGDVEWDPQLSAVIRWEGHGFYGALDEPFQRSLSARVADLFHPHGLAGYLTSKGYRRVATEEAYEIWEVAHHAGGFDLVTVPTNTHSVGFDLAWEDAVGKVAAAEQWYVSVSAHIMVPEALRDACEPTKPE
jgi:hypothetical protein